MTEIIKQRKIWFSLAAILMIGSLAAILGFGLNFGLDFKGGSLLELEFNDQIATRPTVDQISQALNQLDLGSLTTQLVGQTGVILRFNNVDEATHQEVLKTLNQAFATETATEPVIQEKRFDSIGPAIGNELKQKTIWAIGIVLFGITLYITWAFRKVSKPVASWKYGLIAIFALFHDILITVGVFAVLGKIYGMEINAPFIAALLTILGSSVNDTIVVFDRTRENLSKNIGMDFEAVVQKSINEVIVRSINISITTLAVLFAILLLGGPSIRELVLALIIGISAGIYSSVFLASPLLVTWDKISSKK